MWRIVLLVAVVVAAMSALVVAAVSASAVEGQSGMLVIASNRSPMLHAEIWVVDLRTGSRANFSRSPTRDDEPVVSPDRRWVAFVSDRGGREGVWVARPDGTRLRRVVSAFRSVQGLRWDATGRRLGFVVSGQQAGAGAWRSRLWIVPLSGGRVVRVGDRVSSFAWSRDGRRIAVAENSEVSAYGPDGRLEHRYAGQSAAWSRSGDLAVFGASTLIVGADGRVRARVGASSSGKWSPDGRLLAVHTDAGVRVVTAAGRTALQTRLSYPSVGEWASDSRSLLVTDEDRGLIRLWTDGRISWGALGKGTGGWSGMWLAPEKLLTSDGNAIAVNDRGKVRRYRFPVSATSCGGGISSLGMLDQEHVLVVTSLGGQKDADLWLVDPTGGDSRLLLRTRGWESTPSWSPDASLIAFEEGEVLTHGGNCDGPVFPVITVARADGSAVRMLGDGGRDPRWSPDGSKLAYQRYGAEVGAGISVIDVRTGSERQLTPDGVGASPSWSVDGTTVVYANGGRILRVPVLGGSSTEVGSGASPDASPTRPQIAFVRDNALWTMMLDGSNLRQLAPIAAASSPPRQTSPSLQPRWSPDGNKIAIADSKGVVVVTTDGGPIVRIARPNAASITWAPDGRTLAFAAPVGYYTTPDFDMSLGTRSDVFIAAATGGAARRVTRDFANLAGISWRR